MITNLRILAIGLLIALEQVRSSDGGVHGRSAVGQPETVADAAALPADVTHHLEKRMDLEICIGHFDIHKNTIIRTGESQAIGGKYLQGLELDTIEECERLCCETDSCDVYIFESKSGGYCYLFECGPPENFHCKFTRHANYTSSVLTPQVRHNTELTTPRPQLPHINAGTNISQQEWELTNLKAKPEVREKSATAAATASVAGPSAVAASTTGQLATPEIAKVTDNATAHCGRFQFTCHSGECIAVYNACDGIPQCEDGSDEGPECNGMSSSSSSSVAINTQKEASESKMFPNPVNVPYQHAAVMPPQQLPSANMQQPQQQQLTPPVVVATQQVVNNREDAAAWANRKIIEDAQQVDAANAELNSHIFSHKGGLQVASGQNVLLPAYGPGNVNAANLNPMYSVTMQRSGIYLPPQQQQVQQQPLQPQQQQTLTAVAGQQQQGNILMPWPQQQQQLPPGSAYLMNTGVQQPPQLPPPPPPPHAQVVSVMQSHPSNNPMAINQGQQPPMVVPQVVAMLEKTAGKQAANNANDDAETDEYEDYEEKSTEPPKKKQRKHKKIKSKQNKVQSKDPIELSLEQQKQQQQQTAPASATALPPIVAAAAAQSASPLHEQYKIIHENLALEFRDHDGHSERPGGAVLSLSLGLLVTAALAILIGCRMRTVGRRARRLGGKTPYSQEADFLVNGMYL